MFKSHHNNYLFCVMLDVFVWIYLSSLITYVLYLLLDTYLSGYNALGTLFNIIYFSTSFLIFLYGVCQDLFPWLLFIFFYLRKVYRLTCFPSISLFCIVDLFIESLKVIYFQGGTVSFWVCSMAESKRFSFSRFDEYSSTSS